MATLADTNGSAETAPAAKEAVPANGGVEGAEKPGVGHSSEEFDYEVRPCFPSAFARCIFVVDVWMRATRRANAHTNMLDACRWLPATSMKCYWIWCWFICIFGILRVQEEEQAVEGEDDEYEVDEEEDEDDDEGDNDDDDYEDDDEQDEPATGANVSIW